MAKKYYPTVGIDIGSYSIKCVEMLRTQDAIKLSQASIHSIADPSPEAVAAALKEAWTSFAMPPKHVRLSVSGPSVMVRCIALPTMTKDELAGAIRFEAENHIPFPMDECILDFQVLKQIPDKKQMNVLLAAAKKEFVQERLKVAASVGIKPELIDADALCVVNAFELLNDAPAQKTHAVLNVGHATSLFVIVQDGLPFFVRDIAFGGIQITKAVMEAKGISESEADMLKTNRSFENLNELKLASQKAFLPLADELKQFVDYFENEVGEELKAIWLSGGASMSIGAPVVLSERLGKNVALWDNTRKLEISGRIDLKFLKEHSSELNIAFGLALRDLEGSAS